MDQLLFDNVEQENKSIIFNQEINTTSKTKEELLRGKFVSLTLINWNGFFARTFDLDSLVTTLSGGNGAGKSTTMAAFVTALIPDLSLLHFRNTTEAGATAGSRDKGLYGKLRPGICYAILDCINSKKQRILVGVRLQQVAGRDRKVDIKQFSIQGLPLAMQVSAICTEKVADNQARVLTLAELKERIETSNVAQFKQYNSITDYHSMMFDLGLLPKRLRSYSDRSKFYKLIEASLYGGISSAITRSLRGYLLPENNGVQQAFHDMESALRENRMTLAAIKVTQADRDLFRQLITESTQYVAADYIRHANQRKGNIEHALQLRNQKYSSQNNLINEQERLIKLGKDLANAKEAETSLEIDYQGAQDHLTAVTNAVQQQHKIERYQDEVAELQEQVEEQSMILETNLEQLTIGQEKFEHAEQEVDELRNQLADYQQALDGAQTRSLQYKQAMQALERAQDICGLKDLDANNVATYHAQYEAQYNNVNKNILEIEQKLSVTEIAKQNFEQAYSLVTNISGDVARDMAWKEAQKILHRYPNEKMQALQAQQLRAKLNELENKLQQQQDANKLLADLNRKHELNLASLADLTKYYAEQEAKLEQLTNNFNQHNLQIVNLEHSKQQLNTYTQKLKTQLPAWILAKTALTKLEEHAKQEFVNSQEVMGYIQKLLETGREYTVARDSILAEKDAVEQQIQALSNPDGHEDIRLTELAEYFGGVLLSELYDDLNIEDAPYFSALYGPARHAIVVKDLELVKQLLAEVDECPDDLYFIQGDPQDFDDSVYSATELNAGVIVQSSERQLRYSKFPETPVFGKNAREKRLEYLRQQQDELIDKYSSIAFNVQKTQYLQQQFNDFIGQHLAIVFQEDLELQLENSTEQYKQTEKQLFDLTNLTQTLKLELDDSKEQLQQVNRLLVQINQFDDSAVIEDEIAEYQEQFEIALESEIFINQYGKLINQLEPIATALQSDPIQHAQLEEKYQELKLSQTDLQQKLYSLSDVLHRIEHFNYQDSEELVDSDNLNEKLRQRLELAQNEREQLREQLKIYQAQHAQANQIYTNLHSNFNAKQQLLTELNQELDQLGIRIDLGVKDRAEKRKEELFLQLSTNRQTCNELEKQLVIIESELANLNKEIDKYARDYKAQRQQVVHSKSSWSKVQQLIRENDIEHHLNKRELAYRPVEQLRSISDKALGALRNAVTNNEYLRDHLRKSEDTNKLENKVEFFIAVYKHLRARIRQDILQTQDPIDAIEQMEIELSRLTEELKGRENKLSISSESVANIMHKTIKREQNRIRVLNQGLQNISFGQVKSVRLVVNIRDTHTLLLDALTNSQNEHQDLLNNNNITFSEAIAKLYQRVNPQVEVGQKAAQTIGEELLDYRNYLELAVEVYRGTDGWLRAESGALSTGEAIGTGMSILLMVTQSWEDESNRVRGKDIIPCRLLFLDEAARLDGKSIATLFELCERLDMQLLIAAPENISPEKGTTYKLIRKTVNNQEHVHVVGLRGFGNDE